MAESEEGWHPTIPESIREEFQNAPPDLTGALSVPLANGKLLVAQDFAQAAAAFKQEAPRRFRLREAVLDLVGCAQRVLAEYRIPQVNEVRAIFHARDGLFELLSDSGGGAFANLSCEIEGVEFVLVAADTRLVSRWAALTLIHEVIHVLMRGTDLERFLFQDTERLEVFVDVLALKAFEKSIWSDRPKIGGWVACAKEEDPAFDEEKFFVAVLEDLGAKGLLAPESGRP